MMYHQLTSGERYMLSALRKQGLSQAHIARQLGRSPSTISRELRRNACPNDGHYRPFRADGRSRHRRSHSRRNTQFNADHFAIVHRYLCQRWSPEQIAGFLRRHCILLISHETIYKHIWANRAAGGTLYRHLRGASKHRRKRYRAYDSRGRLAGKRHISERPASVEARRTIGHWEIDTVMGHDTKDCIVTLVERKTGYLIIGKLKDRTKEALNRCVIPLIDAHGYHMKTITADNGTEFHGYRDIEKTTGVRFYFATPHHSWERGTNENTNGLIRQYLPKQTSMAGLTQQQCNDIALQINARPRKRHGYRTPEELFDGIA
ncbi:IS30 family transposase [Thiosocius teredinicola]|uniref:IS30 family transposase n=1 Tax=Thiosocius teredinicola TaxID=1973002 RepID=UPI000990DE29